MDEEAASKFKYDQFWQFFHQRNEHRFSKKNHNLDLIMINVF